MISKKIGQLLGVSIFVIVLIFGLSSYIDRDQDSRDTTKQETPQTSTISLTIEGLYKNEQVSISPNETVLEVLQEIDTKDSQILLTTKEYSGLGIIIEGMSGKINGTDNKYWQYEINGVMPQIGADKLELKEGDLVEWFFKKSEF